jgi:hypothetical protein
MCVNKAKNLTIIITTKTIILYREEVALFVGMHHDGGSCVGLGVHRSAKTHTSPIVIIVQTISHGARQTTTN